MIGKTRHHGPGKARGVLRHAPSPGVVHHARHTPPATLRGIVEHFWIVRWDLRGLAPEVRETLPHPSVHLVFERGGRTRIAGVHTGRFTRVLEGEGCVFGVKFRPGGFRPLLGKPVRTITDRSLTLREVFGASSDELEDHVLRRQDEMAMIEAASGFLSPRVAFDPDVDRVADIAAGIAEDRGITTVEAVVKRHGTSKRTLQRLFAEYMGVSPKWVINRYRLHEAVEQLAQGEPVHWASLALELGYFDQAHFIRDFKKLVGRSPGEYVAR